MGAGAGSSPSRLAGGADIPLGHYHRRSGSTSGPAGPRHARRGMRGAVATAVRLTDSRVCDSSRNGQKKCFRSCDGNSGFSHDLIPHAENLPFYQW